MHGIRASIRRLVPSEIRTSEARHPGQNDGPAIAVTVGEPHQNPAGQTLLAPGQVPQLPVEILQRIFRHTWPLPPLRFLTRYFDASMDTILGALPLDRRRDVVKWHIVCSTHPAAALANIRQVLPGVGDEAVQAIETRLTQALGSLSGLSWSDRQKVTDDLESVRAHLTALRAEPAPGNEIIGRPEARAVIISTLASRLIASKTTKREEPEVEEAKHEAIQFLHDALKEDIEDHYRFVSEGLESGYPDRDSHLFVLGKMLRAVGDMRSWRTQREVLKTVNWALRQYEHPDTIYRIAVMLCKAIPRFQFNQVNSGRNMQHKAYKMFRAILCSEHTRVSGADGFEPIHTFLDFHAKVAIISECAGTLASQSASRRPNAPYPFRRFALVRPPIQEALANRMLETLKYTYDIRIRRLRGGMPGWESLLKIAPRLPPALRDKIVRAFLDEMEAAGVPRSSTSRCTRRRNPAQERATPFRPAHPVSGAISDAARFPFTLPLILRRARVPDCSRPHG